MMSTGFAFRHSQGIFLVTDSMYVGLLDPNSLKQHKHFRQWKVTGVDNIYMSYQGEMNYFSERLRFTDDLIDKRKIQNGRIDLEYVAGTFIPRLFSLMEDHKLLDPEEKSESMKGEFLLVTPRQIMLIAHNGYVMEQDKFASIGSSDKFAYAAYSSASENPDPFRFAIQIMDTIENHSRYARYPIMVTDVGNGTTSIIEKKKQYQRHFTPFEGVFGNQEMGLIQLG